MSGGEQYQVVNRGSAEAEAEMEAEKEAEAAVIAEAEAWPEDWQHDTEEDWTQPAEAGPSALEGLSPKELRAFYTEIGQELAKAEAGQMVRNMLARRGYSLNGFHQEFGFPKKVLSEIINGKSKGGPRLATVFAVAEACAFDVEITFRERYDD